jgi:hypothetical protein
MIDGEDLVLMIMEINDCVLTVKMKMIIRSKMSYANQVLFLKDIMLSYQVGIDESIWELEARFV